MQQSRAKHGRGGPLILSVLLGVSLCIVYPSSFANFPGGAIAWYGSRIAPLAGQRGRVERDRVIVSAAPVSPNLEKKTVEALRRDLQNQFSSGFSYTAFSRDVQFLGPVFHYQGNVIHDIINEFHRIGMSVMNPDTVKVEISEIEKVPADFDPFLEIKHAPVKRPFRTKAVFSVHAKWAITAEGLIDLKGLVEQKPFYLSGEDVFRVDETGRIFRHERGLHQDPKDLLAYLNPLAHMPFVEGVMPRFAEAIPTRPSELKR